MAVLWRVCRQVSVLTSQGWVQTNSGKAWLRELFVATFSPKQGHNYYALVTLVQIGPTLDAHWFRDQVCAGLWSDSQCEASPKAGIDLLET